PGADTHSWAPPPKNAKPISAASTVSSATARSAPAPEDPQSQSDSRRARIREIRQYLLSRLGSGGGGGGGGGSSSGSTDARGDRKSLRQDVVLPFLWSVVSSQLDSASSPASSAALDSESPSMTTIPETDANSLAYSGPTSVFTSSTADASTPTAASTVSSSLTIRTEAKSTGKDDIEILTRASLSIGDLEGARHWAEKTLEAWLRWESKDDGHVTDAVDLLRELDRIGL
ncbi:hypothetical protein MKZ38_001508, partial [Zalerion maritima]